MARYIISGLSDIRKIFEKEKIIIFGLGGFPSIRSEIWKIVPDFEVITLNKTGEFDSVREKMPIHLFSADKTKIIKKPGALLNKKSVQNYIKKRAQNKKVGIYIYKSSPEIESICKKNGWTLIADTCSVFEKVSLKKTFFEILSAMNYKRAYELLSFSQLPANIDTLFARFGEKIVIQLMDEGGGRGTFFFDIKNKDSIQRIIQERLILINRKDDFNNLELIISPFIDGPALSIMGCVTQDNGTLPLYAQYQLIDIKEVTGKKGDVQGGFCGHDWSLSENIPAKIQNEAKKLLLSIGQEIKKRGHLGIFGLDLMLDKKTGKLFPLEINTRILGSFPTITYTQYQKKEAPLVAFHLLDFFNIKYEIISEKIYRKGAKRKGAHIILFNPKGYDVECRAVLKGGVYDIHDKKLRFLRLGSELNDIKKRNEFILTEGVPIAGKIYKKNRKLLKVITIESISKQAGKKLNAFGREIIKHIYNNLKLTRHEQ